MLDGAGNYFVGETALGGVASGTVDDVGSLFHCQAKGASEVEGGDKFAAFATNIDRNIDAGAARSHAGDGGTVLSENGAGNVGGVEVAAKAAEDGVGDGFFEGFNFCF